MSRLRGKVALITGAARGQGAAEAERFVAEGARVVMTDVLPEVEKTAEGLGADAVAVRHDVTDPDDWEAAVGVALAEFGRLDVLVNNAGIFRLTPLRTSSVDEYMRLVSVNQLGVFLGMQAVVGPMRSVGGGSVINVSSVAGLLGSPGSAAYTATKFAVRGMTKVAALELADARIRVNSIHPGMVDTAMLDDLHLTTVEARAAIAAQVPMGELVPPDAIAAMAVFLASDDSCYCTGGEFVVDGGLSADLGLNAQV